MVVENAIELAFDKKYLTNQCRLLTGNNGEEMNIHFRDVQTGSVEARAVVEIADGVFLNEITILNIEGDIIVEFPRKSFIGKNKRAFYIDVVTFEDNDKRLVWEIEIKNAYREWRKANKKVLVYEENNKEGGLS